MIKTLLKHNNLLIYVCVKYTHCASIYSAQTACE